MYRNTVLLHPHKRETAIESSCSTYNPLQARQPGCHPNLVFENLLASLIKILINEDHKRVEPWKPLAPQTRSHALRAPPHLTHANHFRYTKGGETNMG